MLKQVVDFAHSLLDSTLDSNSIVVDATCGNGHDTHFLATKASQGKVIAVDIQAQAIEATKKLNQTFKHIEFIQDSHANIDTHLNRLALNQIDGAIFNLGYLPRSDKSIITKGPSTIQAIEALLKRLNKGKLIVLVVYHGHEGGKVEKQKLLDFAENLDQKYFSVIRYGFINQINHPPFVIAIQKR